MKKWMLIAALALSGCAQINDYENAVQTPAPADLQGNWQTVGPQSSLISGQAIASLIINADGSTLDCRQWMRVIAKPGKLTRLNGDYVNVTRKIRVMPLVVDNSELNYDGLTLRKVARPTTECQQALEEVAKQPKAAVIQNIEPQLLRTPITDHNAQS
ncbi:lipoprotein [Pantoea sp. Bo_2]|uniref:Lipoprotein n=1 Tax=Candidatus Pantoea gossypiicola TaxID=2608008 RepID=A0AB34CKA5_9GAMM|nr:MULTISPECIES: lipoprotein YedD [Pantoea]KAA5930360.1 lipoprotein [Pantoea sp. VH_8]KAA5936021.1 lipoprotein [Pantoea sp. VH_4]KAA5940992.1 lipoprotein [Pantoea sp. VH_3]KAA5949118.1 lipoprotein [Pantoea sp. VH_25]KAA5951842.1 lipoprotein [Pantoea sp. VH_24]